MIKVDSVDREKKTVEFTVNGTHIKFMLYIGVLVELSRYRDSQVLDRANMYIQVSEYNKIRRQGLAILKGGSNDTRTKAADRQSQPLRTLPALEVCLRR